MNGHGTRAAVGHVLDGTAWPRPTAGRQRIEALHVGQWNAPAGQLRVDVSIAPVSLSRAGVLCLIGDLCDLLDAHDEVEQ